MKIAPWIFAALFLLAVAVTTPLWVGLVPGATFTSIEPQIVLGLTALIVAVLAVAGTVVYSLLKSQIEATVREEVRLDFTLPLQINVALQYSYIFFQEYSKTWSDATYLTSLNGDQRFLYIVNSAIVNSRVALNFSRSLPEGDLNQRLRDECTNVLAYHLATKHKLYKEEMARLEAVTLAEALRPRSIGNEEITDTLIWVDAICSEVPSEKHTQAKARLESLPEQRSLPYTWRHLLYAKYKPLIYPDLTEPVK